MDTLSSLDSQPSMVTAGYGLVAAATAGGVAVFLETFEMSHMLDLGARLETEPETLPAAELLLAKLQVVR